MGVDDRESAEDLNKEMSECSEREVRYALEEKPGDGCCQASSNLVPVNNDIKPCFWTFATPSFLLCGFEVIYILTYSQLKLAHCYVGRMQKICFQRSYAAKRISEAGLHGATSNSPGISLMDRPSVVTWRTFVYGLLYVAKFRCPLEVSMQVSRFLSLRVCAL